MTRYVALLRGINVGGKNKVPMPELRSLFVRLGHEDVATYVQSGNVIFNSRSSSPKKVMADVERGIAETFDLRVSVLLRSEREMEQIAARNPFITQGAELARLHAMFLGNAPAQEVIKTLDPDRSPPDKFEVIGREVYLLYPNGSGRSKLTIDYFEKKLGASATARNWNTVTKVLQLMGGKRRLEQGEGASRRRPR
ncbi:MAG: DUF1697 domain-containing protein [Actinobacteria bacterium]|nr:DUF1697 domain-containing protein [Actinomycetota bacterium]